MAYLQTDAKKLLKNVGNSQVLGQPQPTPEDQQNPNQQIQPANQALAGSQAIGGDQQPAAPPQAKAPSSGSFSNLQKYAEKNQPGGARLASAVQQGLQTSADIAKKNIEQTGQQFYQGMEQGSLQNRDTAVSESTNAALTAAGGVQDPNAEANRVAIQQQAYKDQQAALQTQLNQYDSDLKKYTPQQEAYNQRQQAKDIADLTLQYYSRKISFDDLHNQLSKKYGYDPKVGYGFQKADNQFNKYDRSKLQGDWVNNINRSAAQHILGSNATLNTDADLQRLQSDPKLKQQYDNYILKRMGYNNKYLTSTDDQYKDLSDTIKRLNQEKNRTSAEYTTAQQMSSFVPEAVSIPDILTQASSFKGQVSDERLKEILNAIYKGPSNLSDLQSYNKTLDKVKGSERRLGMVGKSGVDSALLQDMFSRPERDYTRGERTLDAALLGKSEKLNDILKTKEGIGSVADIFSQKENLARGDASARSSEIDKIREDSRGQVQDISSARSGQVDERLANVVKNWDKLPQYMRDSIQQGLNRSGSGIELSQDELSILGAENGTGLYNLLKDVGIDKLLQTTVADKEKLISKKEQGQLSRLEALARLSDDYGKEGSKLNYNNIYEDSKKAGTQSMLDAIDRKKFASTQKKAEDKFVSNANKTTLSATGVGEESTEGGMFGSDKISRASHTNTVKVKDLLKKMGYTSEYIDSADGAAMTEAIAGSIQQGPSKIEDNGRYLDAFTSGQAAHNAYGDAVKNPVQTAVDPASWARLTSGIGPAYDATNALVNLIPGGKNLLGGASTAVFGGNTKHAESVAMQRAQEDAAKKMKEKVKKWEEKTGFNNRLESDNYDKYVLRRLPKFTKLMAGLDLTNTDYDTNPLTSSPNPLDAPKPKSERINLDNFLVRPERPLDIPKTPPKYPGKKNTDDFRTGKKDNPLNNLKPVPLVRPKTTVRVNNPGLITKEKFPKAKKKIKKK